MKDLPSLNTNQATWIKEGTVIFVQGEPSHYLYLVKRGKVLIFKKSGNSLSTIKMCGDKEILNEVSVLTNQPNEFSAIAKTDVEVVKVSQKDILSVISNSPDWVPEIFQTLCERLKSTEMIIQEHNLQGEKAADLFITKEEEKKYLLALSDYKVK